MKIAFFVSKFPFLTETFILNQITGLIDRCHNVHIYARRLSDHQAIHTDIARYDLSSRTFYHGGTHLNIPKTLSARIVKSFIILMNHRLSVPLLKSFNIAKFGRRSASLSLFYSTHLFLQKKIDSYDIIHCHFGTNAVLAAQLKYLGAIKGKLITSFHGYDISKYPENNGFDVYDFLFKEGDLFLPISKRWKERLIELGCPEEKTIVHRMGIDTKTFSFHPRDLRPAEKIYLLTVGRFVEKKGVAYGIQAVASLLRKYPQIEYRIIGDGPLRPDLSRMIQDTNAGEQIKLLGWRTQEDVVKLMREAHIFLAPSITSSTGDQEGIPVVLMEAMAQGLPIVSTWHSGIPELVQDGVSGVLAPERDSKALAAKLDYLLAHPERWTPMGCAGRAHIQQFYDINSLNDKLVTLYSGH
jgi:colanic acid/amylovoran biosynthesis glycosyltransferase